MTHRDNIMAILECHFTGFKEEIIESACNRILGQEERDTKTGHWIHIQELVGVDKEGNEMLVTVGYMCSKCKEKHESKTLYCHCGAKMQEVEEWTTP